MLHGHLNLPHDYIGRVGPGSYNPKHTYNDIIYDNNSDIILANRITKEIEKFDNKIYSRDIFKTS